MFIRHYYLVWQRGVLHVRSVVASKSLKYLLKLLFALILIMVDFEFLWTTIPLSADSDIHLLILASLFFSFFHNRNDLSKS